MVNVLLIPYFEQNSYQRLLADALADEGVTISKRDVVKPFPVLRSLVRDPDIDVIHLIWTHPFFLISDVSDSRFVNGVITAGMAALFLVELLLVRTLGVRLVWTAHNKSNHERRFTGIDRAVSRGVARVADHVKVETDSAGETVRDLFGVDSEKIAVCHEGSYVDAYPNEISRADARDRLGIGSDEFVYCSLGQIREYKGITDLVRVFRDVDVDDARLLIAGSTHTDELEQEIATLAAGSDRIDTHFGFVPDDELQVYMNAADVVVLPYRDILTSGGVMLALSFGKPVVAPALGCIPDVVGDDGGILYSPFEADGLGDALETAADLQRDDLDAMGERNARLAASHTWEEVGRFTADLYRNALAAQ